MLQVTPLILFHLNRFKESLEVASAKTLGNKNSETVISTKEPVTIIFTREILRVWTHTEVVTLDHLQEESRPVLHILGKDL